jgi:hypothetical protein
MCGEIRTDQDKAALPLPFDLNVKRGASVNLAFVVNQAADNGAGTA